MSSSIVEHVLGPGGMIMTCKVMCRECRSPLTASGSNGVITVQPCPYCLEKARTRETDTMCWSGRLKK